MVARALPLLLLTVVAMTAAVAAGCGNGDDGEGDGRLSVLAGTVQIEALAKVVAGDAVDRADLVLRNGIGLDDYLKRALGDDGKAVVVTAGIEVRVVDGEEDPHVWHNPLNVKVMVKNIADALAAKDPANEAGYRSRAEAYLQRLDEVDGEISALIASIPPENRKMVTNHDAFGYFIERYGLEFVGAVIPSLSTQAEPSAKDIAALQDLIRKEGVKAIFAESSLDPKVASQIAKDTGVKIVDDLYGDSLGEPGSGAETVDGMLLANARKIAEALK